MKAGDVMTPGPACISPDASIADAIRLLLERKFSGLPVVDARGSLVGIVTEGDLLRRNETATQRKRPSWIEFLMGPGRLATEYVQTTGRKVSDVMTPEVRTVTEDAPVASENLILVHIDDVVRQGSAPRRCLRTARSGVYRVRPCQAKGASAPHYSSSRISKECAEDVLR
jgi:CBS domain-containing protein